MNLINRGIRGNDKENATATIDEEHPHMLTALDRLPEFLELCHQEQQVSNPHFSEVTTEQIAEYGVKYAEATNSSTLFNRKTRPKLPLSSLDGPLIPVNDTFFLANTTRSNHFQTLTPHPSNYNATNTTIPTVDDRGNKNAGWITAIVVLAVFLLFFASLEIRRKMKKRKAKARREAREVKKQKAREERERAIRNGELVEIDLGGYGHVSHVEFGGKDEEEVAEAIERSLGLVLVGIGVRRIFYLLS